MSEFSLHEKYFDRRIDDLDRRLSERFVLNEAAVAKAERSMTDRLNAEEANRIATRTHVEQLDHVVQELRRAKANLDGRLMVLSASISLAVTVLLWALAQMMGGR